MDTPAFRELVFPFFFTRVETEMGANSMFDYAFDEPLVHQRLTRCYELAAKTMFPRNIQMIRRDLPAPRLLIHGRWSSPGTRAVPIDHAWVMLSDERIWEPITRTLCDPDIFYAYTHGVHTSLHTQSEACRNMIKHGHYGPW